MSPSIELQGSRSVWEPSLNRPLDDTVWQAWVAKGRAQDRRRGSRYLKSVKWASIAGLLLGAGLWSHPVSYDVVLRFIVAAGALVVMFHSFRSREYAFAAVFGALALLYNPVVSVFGFSGEWQRALVLTSAVPFVASLAWRKQEAGAQ